MTKETECCAECWQSNGAYPRLGFCVKSDCPCHLPKAVGWEEELREEVAGNMNSIEAAEHLVDFIRTNFIPRSEVEKVVGEAITPNAREYIEEVKAGSERPFDAGFDYGCRATKATLKHRLLGKGTDV